MKAFQVMTHHARSTNLNESDVGLWCFTYEGQYYGFCETEEDAIAKIQNFDPPKDATVKIRF